MMASTAPHVCQEHAETAKQQDGSRRQGDIWNQPRRNSGECDNGQDLQGERAIVDEQSDQLAKGGSQRIHGKTAVPGRRARMTAARPAARNSAAKATIERSAPGQATPRPSP